MSSHNRLMDWTNNGGQRRGHSSELSAPLSSTHRRRYAAPIGLRASLALLLTCFSCTTGPVWASESLWNCEKGRSFPSKAVTQLKLADVVALASAAAKKEGWNLAEYRHSSTCFSSRRYPEWTVFFEGLELRPGNHFSVWVRDDTKATRIMPGE